ncbi:MAG: pyridoxal phosphate-dependent aminotransferase [Gemmatimonadota bacterium]
MDRRGFVTSTMTAGLAGLSGTALGGLSARGNAPGFLARLLGAEGARGGALEDYPPGGIKLSSNENPLGLSPAARSAAIDALGHANRYPHDYAPAVYEALAEYTGVAPENIVLGAGSTEVLQMAVQAYQGPNVPLVIAEPTFEDVPRYQKPFPYNVHAVPLTRDDRHDLERMREVAEEHRRPAVVYICNPNNPTGTITPSSEVDAWIADAPETTTFLVDEAYYEYADHPEYRTALPWIQDHPNVIVVRTFSKIFGMAGMRLGYGVAHPDTIGRLRDFVMANNPNVLAAAAGIASLRDPELISRSRSVNDDAKEIAEVTLTELDLEFLPTYTNFILHRIHGDLREYIARMREAGIRVGRPFPPMLEWNRVSFGLPSEMAQWADTLRSFRAKGWV